MAVLKFRARALQPEIRFCMQVAVIGGGVTGVSTAYFLASAGHEVVVLERFSNVAQESSFGNAGLVAPGCVAPWAVPGSPRHILSRLLRSDGPLLLHARLNPALWSWLKKWKAECELERYRINRERLLRLGRYSQVMLAEIRQHHDLSYERTAGVLQMLRSPRDLELAAPGLEMLAAEGVEHHVVDEAGAHAIEPGLSYLTPFTNALYFPQDEAGNCALYTRQLKQIAQAAGVQFHFNSPVDGLEPAADGVAITIGDQRFNADAAVVAAGGASIKLLGKAAARLPVQSVKSYCATAPIKNYDQAPNASVVDDTSKTTVARMGNRIRVAGLAEFGSRGETVHDKALRLLVKAGEEWFPGAANFHNATLWSGTRPILPDGVPLLGRTSMQNVFINLVGGAGDWTCATGAGRVVADLVSGQTPDIDLDGLSMARYG